MKKKIIVFLFVLIMYFVSFTLKEKEETYIKEVNQEAKKVFINYKEDTHELDLDEYVIGVVACEMPASFNIEALKAMAVAARTYALYKVNNEKNYILKTDTTDQCYISLEEMKKKWNENTEKYYNKIKNAVVSTKNEIIEYNNEPILAMYFSISNGYTENVENVFNKKLDYLVSVASSWDSKYKYKEESKKISIEEFSDMLNIEINNNTQIEMIRNNSNRVQLLKINNKSINGTDVRKKLNLKSTDFEIVIEDKVIVTTKGYGHGVGMSQYGANSMASEGYKYDEILKYYYKHTNLMNI